MPVFLILRSKVHFLINLRGRVSARLQTLEALFIMSAFAPVFLHPGRFFTVIP